ncbi:helix-turn-helix domain-containing protein [Streptomyces sp. BH097]|uniref:helix-turn-helix domain-containing protein n=1 Tax=unclassified Streptomyces TaxID=2593676 RepID=UPI003BB6A656
MTELHDPIAALLSSPSDLPPPADRRALRRADNLTQDMVAQAVGVRRLAVARWETGVTPRRPHLEQYVRLLAGLARKHPQVTSWRPATEASMT